MAHERHSPRARNRNTYGFDVLGHSNFSNRNSKPSAVGFAGSGRCTDEERGIFVLESQGEPNRRRGGYARGYEDGLTWKRHARALGHHPEEEPPASLLHRRVAPIGRQTQDPAFS